MTRPPQPSEAELAAEGEAARKAEVAAEAETIEALAEQTPEPERAVLQMPVGVRSVALGVIALLASVYVLHWASAVFIPLLLGVMFSYALSPAVDRLEHWHIPRSLSAAVLILAILAGFGWTGYRLSDDASALVETLPAAAQKLRETLRDKRGTPTGAIDQVQRAAAQLERAAEESGSGDPLAKRGVTRVQIEKPRFNIKDYLVTGTLSLVAMSGQLLVVCFIAYFLIASGNTFRRKMVKIAGPTFTQKKITIQALDEIDAQIQRYLLVQLFTSALVGVATWLVFLWIGLDQAAVWGVVAAVLNLVPYLGSLVLMAASSVVGFMQFGSIETVLLIAGASLVIHLISGYLLTPWLTSRASRMNPVVIFVGVLAWGWLWGIWGMLLGMPILMAVKAVCDRVDDLKPIGELLGD
jgi:predicted PurR-regulated permease PerM